LLIFRAKTKKSGDQSRQSENNDKNVPRTIDSVEKGRALSYANGGYLSSEKPSDGPGSTFPSYGYATNGDSGTANIQYPDDPDGYGETPRDSSSGVPNPKDDNQPMSPDTSTPKDNYGTSPTSDDAPKADGIDGDNSAVDNNDNNDNDDKAEENKQGPTGKRTRIALLQEAQRVQSSAGFPKNDVVSKGDIKNEDDSAKSDNDNSDVSDKEDDAPTPAPAPAPVPAPKKVTKLPPPKSTSKVPKKSTAPIKAKPTKPAGKPSTRETPSKKAKSAKLSKEQPKPSAESDYDSAN